MFQRRKKGDTKYGNKFTTCLSSHQHKSKKEAKYCDKLLARLQACEFKTYDVEVSFTLQEKCRTRCDILLRPITYKADFVIVHHDDSIEVIDVKGWRTEVFKIKWKLLQYKYRDARYLFTLA